MKLSDGIETFLVYCAVERGLSKTTIASYQSDLKQLMNFFGEDFEIENFTNQEIQKYFCSFNDLEPASIGRKQVTIREFLNYANYRHYLSKTISIDSVKLDKKIPDILTSEEISALMNAIDVNKKNELKDRVMMELMYASGLRVSELILLNRNNLSIETKSLKIKGKGGKERFVPLSNNAIYYINKYLNEVRAFNNHESSMYLFINEEGKPYTRQNFYLRIKKYALRAGITKDVHPHTLRHSFATHLLENDASILTVQQLLGHSNITTTQRYTHLTNKKIKSEYQSLMEKADEEI